MAGWALRGSVCRSVCGSVREVRGACRWGRALALAAEEAEDKTAQRPSGEDGRHTVDHTDQQRSKVRPRVLSEQRREVRKREAIPDHQQNQKATTSWSVKSSRLQVPLL